MQLAKKRYWRILLHYRPSLTGRMRSLIDDPAFFLSPQGKYHPEAELEATLRAFFTPAPAGKQPARCRFMARFTWLQRQLGIDESRLPQAACSDYEELAAKVDPRSAVLVFPGTHINSPASMFGHTLLILEGPYRSRLLAYAVNYSAFTDETNGLSYAFKGIFGLYHGYFSLLPYYQKVREYSDLERRDVWEYPLNLTPAEVRRMLRHIWELRTLYSDYYFFDENCSYDLLFLLEAARPSVHLTDRTRPWVIPIDTVRLVRKAGLIKRAVYRPSKATRIGHLADSMDDSEQRQAVALIHRPARAAVVAGEQSIPRPGRIRILDLAAEDLEYRYLRHQLDQQVYRRQYVALLKERSRLGRLPAADSLPTPVRPDLGHGSARLGVGLGTRRGDFFTQLSLRPAYHQLLDPDQGFQAGAQIEFASLALRWYPQPDRLRLHRFDLVNIVSLAPRNRFFHPISWKIVTGLVERGFADGRDHLVYRLNPGGGFSFGTEKACGYGLMETELQLSGRFRDDYALGAGGSAGGLITLSPSWKTHLWGRLIWFAFGDPSPSVGLHLAQNWRLSRSQSLQLQFARNREGGLWFTEAVLAWHLFW